MVRFRADRSGRSRRLAAAHDIDDLRRQAARAVPRPIFDFVDGGAGDESTLRGNREAFDSVRLVPRILKDVSTINTATTLLGRAAARPIVLAPVGLARVAHPLGEIATARAAAAHGIPMVLSTMASISPEDIARHAPDADRWFQLYLWRDREASLRLVQRAKDAGFRVLVLTVDVPVAGNRLRDARHGLNFPPSLPLRTAVQLAARPRWVWNTLTHDPISYAAISLPKGGFIQQANGVLDATATFRDLEWLRSVWDGPLIVKGVMSPTDALALRDAGVDGVVVSNHGGRQLEHELATAHALPGIRVAVGTEMSVFVDGGIRSGAHIAGALALGADAVLVGRSYLYGLMAGGEAGLDRSLQLLEAGLERTMALLGAATLSDIDADMVR